MFRSIQSLKNLLNKKFFTEDKVETYNTRTNFIANRGSLFLDKHFYLWAVKKLNPKVNTEQAANCFDEVFRCYMNSRRYFHKGLGHPRSLFPVHIQSAYKDMLLKGFDDWASDDKEADAQAIFAAFYHDVVHRKDARNLPLQFGVITSAFIDDETMIKRVELLSCDLAEKHLTQLQIQQKKCLPILLSIIATIPFSHYSHAKNLSLRLHRASETLSIPLSKIDLSLIVHAALQLAYRDLASYAEDDLEKFSYKTRAMMLERFPIFLDANHTLVDEINAVKDFYNADKNLLARITANEIKIYDSIVDGEEDKQNNLAAFKRLQEDNILQGAQLGALTILMGILIKEDPKLLQLPVKNVLQHKAVQDFMKTFMHLHNESISSDAMYLQPILNQAKPCKVNGVLIPIALQTSAFMEYCLNRVSTKTLIEFAELSTVNTHELIPLIDKYFKPHVIIFADLNSTIMLADPAGGKDLTTAISELLAKKFVFMWGESQKAITYAEYVQENLCLKGDREDERVKQSKLECYRNFIPYWIETNHKLLPKVKKNFDELQAIFAEGKGEVMPSFINLIQYLQKENFPFSIMLRTFGEDLEYIAKEIELKTSIRFNREVSIDSEGSLCLADGVHKTPEAMLAAIKPGQHYACQDNYPRWKLHKHAHAGAKPKPLGYQLGIFLDDHALDKEILNVLPVKSLGLFGLDQRSLQDQLIKLHRIVPVLPMAASRQENYFIEKFKLALNTPLQLNAPNHSIFANKEKVTGFVKDDKPEIALSL